MANNVHDGEYTVFAYNDESLDTPFWRGVTTEDIAAGLVPCIRDIDNTRRVQFISTTDIDSALLGTGYPVNMATADADSDSLLLTMYGRDTLDVNDKFMQDND